MSVRIICGDAREVLKTLPDGSVQCCVTSPPYFGLRDYQTASWQGGDAECDHKVGRFTSPVSDKQASNNGSGYVQARTECPKCGAVRTDQQIGLESTVEEYVAELVAVFRDVRRVLRDDGTCWINLGDSYCGGGGFSPNAPSNLAGSMQAKRGGAKPGGISPHNGLKHKDLIGVPWRVAFALQEGGWYLRSDIIWHKPNPMPESVRDRPTKSHEYLFLLSKQPRYYWDNEAVKEPVAEGTLNRPARLAGHLGGQKQTHPTTPHGSLRSQPVDPNGRNIRSVWTIATQPFSESHFAVFPTEIPRRAILAGTSERGACAACGAPWKRVMEKAVQYGSGSGRADNVPNGKYAGSAQAESGSYDIRMGPQVSTRTTGWAPSCACDAGEPIPCVCLDPFAGAGTTGLVADRLGRDAILIELSPEYARMAEKRISGDAPMFAAVEVES